MKYMQAKGYRITPVNPGSVGKEILGEPVYTTLSDIARDFDVIQIFRPSDAVPPTPFIKTVAVARSI